MILLPRDKIFPYLTLNNDNLFINYLENENLNEEFSFKFKCQDFYEKYLKDEFENYIRRIELDYNNEILFDKNNNFDFSYIAKIINNKINPEFIIDEENLRSAYEIIDVESEIDDNLIMKIENNIKKTINKKDLGNLKDVIRNNVTKLEENIKLKLFYNYFIKIILRKVCIKSIKEKFENLKDDNLNFL